MFHLIFRYSNKNNNEIHSIVISATFGANLIKKSPISCFSFSFCFPICSLLNLSGVKFQIHHNYHSDNCNDCDGWLITFFRRFHILYNLKKYVMRAATVTHHHIRSFILCRSSSIRDFSSSCS